MSIRRKPIIVLAVAGFLLLAALVVSLDQQTPAPIGKLSGKDVREIRRVVTRVLTPGRNSFTMSNLRFWPTLIRIRSTFRIDDIQEDAVGTTTIHADGTRDEPDRSLKVLFHASGFPGTNKCVVKREKGRWAIAADSDDGPVIVFP
jgi:hypothetical protein